MRKCIFYLTLILAAFRASAAGFSFQVPSFYSDFKLNGINARLAEKIPETAAGDSPDFTAPAWSLSLDARQIFRIPFNFVSGQIDVSGPVSKLNSPELSSTVSPFSGTVAVPQPVTVSRPTSASAKPPAFSADLALDFRRKLPLNCSFLRFTDTTGRLVDSAFIKYSPCPGTDFAFTFTTGEFLMQSTCTTWFSEAGIFPDTVQRPFSFQFGSKTRFFSTKETFSFFYGFNEEEYFTFSSENSISAGNFQLNLAAFKASSGRIITASSKKLKTVSQLRINPQFSIYSPKNTFRIRTGAAFLAEEKIKSLSETDFSGKSSAGLEFRTVKSQTRTVFTLSGMDLSSQNGKFTENITCTGCLSGVFYVPFHPSFSSTFTITPDTGKFSLKNGIKILPPLKPFQNVSSSLTLKGAGREFTAGEFSFSTGLRLKNKVLSVSMTAGLSVSW